MQTNCRVMQEGVTGGREHRRQGRWSSAKRLSQFATLFSPGLQPLPSSLTYLSLSDMVILQFYLDHCSIYIIMATGSKILRFHMSQNIYPSSICLGIEF